MKAHGAVRENIVFQQMACHHVACILMERYRNENVELFDIRQ